MTRTFAKRWAISLVRSVERDAQVVVDIKVEAFKDGAGDGRERRQRPDERQLRVASSSEELLRRAHRTLTR